MQETEGSETIDEILRASIERQALEAAAKRLEKEAGNGTYMQAWKRAARIVRSLKPD